MFGLKVKKLSETVIIKWQFSKVVIPSSEILDVSLDHTYGGKENTAIRIGTPSGTTDRVVIKTKTDTYILYTSNPNSIIKTIRS